MLRLEEWHFCVAEPLYNGSVATQLTGAFGLALTIHCVIFFEFAAGGVFPQGIRREFRFSVRAHLTGGDYPSFQFGPQSSVSQLRPRSPCEAAPRPLWL
jgi:hypothetical protein